MQVIPVGPNMEMLENIPHKTVEDIAVVYRVELPNAADSSATTLVTNQLLAEYGVTADQLHVDAGQSSSGSEKHVRDDGGDVRRPVRYAGVSYVGGNGRRWNERRICHTAPCLS